jgi:acylphosphatase
MEQGSYQLRVSGRVQGVGFRYAARNQARSLGLKGWVSNLEDGSVLIRIQGRHASCLRFISWCRQGPPYAWVENVESREAPHEELGPFSVRY